MRKFLLLLAVLSSTVGMWATGLENQIKSINDLENTKAYYLRSKRGALLYNSDNPTQLSSTVAYGNISNTSPAAEWAIIKKNDKYYFYSLEGKKFIGKNADEAGRYPMQVLPQNDVQIVESTVDDYPFVFSTDNYGAINHFNHGAAPGVANWKGDGSKGGLKSLGDDGSVHQIMAVRDLTDEEVQAINNAFMTYTPNAETEYVLYDVSHKVFLDINNLATAPQQAVCTELAKLNSEKQSLYITAEGLSWQIHTATGKYLGQYTDQNQWNSKVNEDQSEFAWTSNPVLENGNIFIMLQNTSGKRNGFLGNEGHANGSALFVNQDNENCRLKLKLHEASLVYKVITTETNGAAVYEGKNYTNGEYIFANATLTDADIVAKSVLGTEFENITIDEENKTVTLTYTIAANFKEGDKFFIRNKDNAANYIAIQFDGGKLDNSQVPTTKRIYYTNGSNKDYKFCWELKATTHNDEECFLLYNPYYDWYVGPLTGTTSNTHMSKNADGAGRFKIETEGDYFVFHCLTSNVSAAGQNGNFLHLYAWGGSEIVGWERSANASQWLVEEVTEEMEAQWQSTLASQYNTLTQYKIGTGANQYSGMPEEMIDGFNALTLPEEASAIEKARYSVYALYEYGSAVDELTLNMPPAGFYRIKSTNSVNDSRNGQYVQNYVNGDGLALNRDTDARSIMYFCNNNLLSYASGKYLNGYNGEDLIGEVGTTPTTWTIEENTNAVASYALSVPSGGYMSDWGDGDKTSSGQKSTYETWSFESVETLPVTITSAKYATFYAPCNVTLPSGLTAYYVSNTGNGYATLTDIKDNVVPANTGVLLYADVEEPTTYNLTIGGNATEVTSLLEGTVASTYVDEESYVLSAQGTPAVVGFYKAMMNQQGNTSFLNNGFKAYLPANGNNARALVFDFGTETAIESIESVENNAVVYDLAGRRVQNAQNGIFIVNGKKVVR